MKKVLFVSLLLLINVTLCFSQQDILKETQWHIEYMIIDGEQYDSPIVNAQGIVNPNIVFEEDQAYAVMDPNSDSFFGEITYDDTNNQFTFVNGATTLFGCEQFCEFAGLYFNLLMGDATSNTFTYTLTFVDVPPNGLTVLTITDAAGNVVQYQDQPILAVNTFEKEAITIHPNPTNGRVTVETENTPIQHITIYNILGELVKKSSSKNIDISEVPNGVYLAIIEVENKQWIQKIVKR